MCDIQRDEAERQMARRGIGEPGSDRRAGLAFLRNRREAVVRRCDDVSRIEQAEFIERGADAGEIVIGIADCGKGGRAFDPRNQRIQAVLNQFDATSCRPNVNLGLFAGVVPP